METEDGVLVIRRILVRHRLAVPGDLRGMVEEVHRDYPLRSPLYRTLHHCIDIGTSYEIVAAAGSDLGGL